MGLFDIFKEKEKTYICARCKKEITDEESKWIGNHRFCDKCATPIKKTTITQKKHVDVSTNSIDESCWKDRWCAERLSVMKQLDELQKTTKECNKVIGKIYINNYPPFEERNQLKAFFKNAELIEQFSVMGQGDNEVDMIFSINNLLIGIRYFAYWRSPFTLIEECNVYRFSEGKSLDSLDFNKIKKELFF